MTQIANMVNKYGDATIFEANSIFYLRANHNQIFTIPDNVKIFISKLTQISESKLMKYVCTIPKESENFISKATLMSEFRLKICTDTPYFQVKTEKKVYYRRICSYNTKPKKVLFVSKSALIPKSKLPSVICYRQIGHVMVTNVGVLFVVLDCQKQGEMI